MDDKMSRKNVKKRNWAFVLYPESAPANWLDLLQQTGLQCAISPLHDKDLNPDGEPKKAHYHIILMYSGPTSFNVVRSLTASLNQPIPQPLEQVRGYYRYFTHKDNPEKAQYSESDIVSLNGFDITDFIELSRSEINQTIRAIQQLCRAANLYEYSDLLDFLLDNEMYSEHEVASSHTILFNSYLCSRRHKRRFGREEYSDE